MGVVVPGEVVSPAQFWVLGSGNPGWVSVPPWYGCTCFIHFSVAKRIFNQLLPAVPFVLKLTWVEAGGDTAWAMVPRQGGDSPAPFWLQRCGGSDGGVINIFLNKNPSCYIVYVRMDTFICSVCAHSCIQVLHSLCDTNSSSFQIRNCNANPCTIECKSLWHERQEIDNKCVKILWSLTMFFISWRGVRACPSFLLQQTSLQSLLVFMVYKLYVVDEVAGEKTEHLILENLLQV